MSTQRAQSVGVAVVQARPSRSNMSPPRGHSHQYSWSVMSTFGTRAAAAARLETPPTNCSPMTCTTSGFQRSRTPSNTAAMRGSSHCSERSW